MPHICENRVLWKEKNGVVTVLLISSGNFFEFNAVGSAVWRLLAAGHSTDEIIDSLTKTYGVPREQLALDVHGFIVKMIAADLLASD